MVGQLTSDCGEAAILTVAPLEGECALRFAVGMVLFERSGENLQVSGTDPGSLGHMEV